MSKTFYLSTPIYYPSDKLHIGHSYCTVAADTICRFKRQTGYDVYFLTGSDEHGQKIERVAQAHGMEPQAYVDKIVAGIKDLWNMMDISYDGFIRTTDPRHVSAIQKIFKKLYEQGDIYKGKYSGHYCTPCESYWLERQLVDGNCPDCGRPVELVEEESYFFKLSKYAPRLIKHIEDNPDFIQPPSRANEMLSNFLRPGLEDLSVSRTSFKWGIPVDFDPGHVVYVWIDALSNYITALGYLQEDDSLFQKYWPADVHLVGKEIVRFHTIIWPIMLMALGLPLPKQVFGHGWLILEGGKMSKSKGNVVDPVALVNSYGVDAIRYFLLREVAFGSDGLFSNEALLYRINSDLANDLGNLLSRTVAMIEKYFGGSVPAPIAPENVDGDLIAQAQALQGSFEGYMNQLKFSDALSETWKMIGSCNKYIDVTMPWKLAQDPQSRDRLGTVLYNLAECLRIIGVTLVSSMTRTAPKIFDQLGVAENITTWESIGKFGATPAGTKVKKLDSIFPRIDVAKELGLLEGSAASEEKQADDPAPEEKPDHKPEITIDQFSQIELRTAKVLECEYVSGSDRLLKFKIKVGEQEHTVLSGIRKWYEPQKLIGKTVVWIANLKPRKIFGIESRGMLLSAADSDETNLSVITVLDDIEDGCVVR